MSAAPIPATADLLTFALDLAGESAGIALSFYRGDLGTRTKADGSLVTRADEAIEAHLRRRIGQVFPGHAILGEEQGLTAGDGEARWILDPIDGTHGFARGMPVWATLIACERNGEIEVGVASAPALGTRWWAGRGLGAWRSAQAVHAGRPERIAVSSIGRMDEAQVLYGEHRYCLDRWGASFESLLVDAWRTRGFGDFWSHCLVAEGSAEAMLEGDIKPWDIAALQVIVEEAGGRLTDGSGARTLEAGYSITSNAAFHDVVLGALRG